MRPQLFVGVLLLCASTSVSHAGTLLPVGSGFSNPQGIALDGSGNVFVADQDNNAVKEVLAAGGFTTVNTLGNGFSEPTAVAVAADGNVFVVDAAQSTIKEILAAGGYATVTKLGSGFAHPIIGIAVNGVGDVLFADTVGTIQAYSAASNFTTLSTLASSTQFGTCCASAFALDRAGNVFLVGGTKVEELFASSGYSTSRSAGPVGPNTHDNAFHGAATDDAGNLFVGQYEFGVSGGVFAPHVLKLLPSSGFNYNIVYSPAPPNAIGGIALSGDTIFLSGATANAVDEITPVPTPVVLQEFGVD